MMIGYLGLLHLAWWAFYVIGSFFLYLAIILAAFSGLASVVGRYREDGRLMIAGERAGYALCAVLVCASLILINSFLDHDYSNKYVQRYSDNNMPWYYLVAAFWGVVIWKEFDGAPTTSQKLLKWMFLSFFLGLGIIILSRV